MEKRIRLRDEIFEATPEEMEDFQADRVARLREVFGGAADDIEFRIEGNSISVDYEMSVEQALMHGFDSDGIARSLVTQAGVREPYDTLLATVDDAKARYRAIDEAPRRRM